jgi:ankyrin repeat protein
MQSNAERTDRNTSIVGPATQAPREVAGVFAVGARIAGLRLFERLEKLAERVESASVKLGLKDAEFMRAVRAGDTSSAEALLASGVNPLAPSARRDGWSPVHEMAKLGDVQMLDILIEHVRAHPEHATVFNAAEHVEHRIPFQIAYDDGHMPFVERLIATGHSHLTSIDREGRSGLSRLAFDGQVGLLDRAIEIHGPAAIATHADSLQMPMQHEAVLGGSENRVGVITRLHSHGVDLFARNGPDGGTLLHSAANVGDGAVLSHLLDQKNLEVDAVNRQGMTALHIAAAHGRHSLAQTLLDRGANPNAVSIHDPARNLVEATPLMLAAARGYRNTVDVITNDPKTRVSVTSKSSGLHAIDYAKRNGHDSVAVAIEDNLRRRVAGSSPLEMHARIANALRPTMSSQNGLRPGRRP